MPSSDLHFIRATVAMLELQGRELTRSLSQAQGADVAHTQEALNNLEMVVVALEKIIQGPRPFLED